MFKESTHKTNLFIRDLGDGLLLRHASPEDAEALADFNAKIHSDDGPEKPDQRIGDWVRDLLARPHPTFQPGDFTIVEDTKTNQIVSSINLISQEWTYAGIPFKVGRPELVGTLPEYRNRGLVRAQFDLVHAWSAERGELLQGITGIPYYYRIFGYEMAVNLGGGRWGYVLHVTRLKEGETEPYIIRPAVEQDIPFLTEIYAHSIQRDLLACTRTAADWRYEILEKSPRNLNRIELRIIENTAGEPVGYLGHTPWSTGDSMVANLYHVKPGASWADITPSVVRYLWSTGLQYSKNEGKSDEFGAFGFQLGEHHPVYDLMRPTNLPWVRKPYAWYVRVPDLPAFLRQIQPVLEQRLANSLYCGYTGELKVTFYRSGLHFKFEAGRITQIEPYRPTPVGHAGEAAFPGLTFLQLVLGYRNLEELRYAFTDCWAQTTAAGLLEALFPKQASSVWPIS